MESGGDRRLKAVEKLRQHFLTCDTLNPSHHDALSRNLSIKPGLEGSAKSRNRVLRTILATIYNELGYEAFFLCAIALRPTQLGTAKEGFIGQFRDWWGEADIPEGFRSIAQALLRQYRDLIPTNDIDLTGMEDGMLD